MMQERRNRIRSLEFDYQAQAKDPIERCNLCESDRWTIIAHEDRYGYAARATTCNHCGLTVLSPRMTAEAYGHFYKSTYRPLVSAYHGRLIDATTVQDEQRVYAQHMIALIEPFLRARRGGTLLDVGGSTGVVASALVQAFDLKGVVLDPAPDEVAFASSAGLRTITALIEDWVPDAQYDIVTLFQTVDHLLDAAGALDKLRSAVSDDGILVIDIVDFRAAYLRNSSVEEAVKIDHPYYFTQETIELYFLKCGFEVRLRSYSPDHLHVAYVCTPTARAEVIVPDPQFVRRFLSEVRSVQNGRGA